MEEHGKHIRIRALYDFSVVLESNDIIKITRAAYKCLNHRRLTVNMFSTTVQQKL